MPQLPLLVYDGECDFCRACVAYARRLNGESMEYAPFQQVSEKFPQIPLADFQASAQLILPDGKVYSRALAVYHTLAHTRRYRWLLWSYAHVPGFARASERGYRFVADHRPFFSQLVHD